MFALNLLVQQSFEPISKNMHVTRLPIVWLQIVNRIFEKNCSVKIIVQNVSGHTAIIFSDNVTRCEENIESADRNVVGRIVFAKNCHIQDWKILDKNKKLHLFEMKYFGENVKFLKLLRLLNIFTT